MKYEKGQAKKVQRTLREANELDLGYNKEDGERILVNKDEMYSTLQALIDWGGESCNDIPTEHLPAWAFVIALNKRGNSVGNAAREFDQTRKMLADSDKMAE